MSNILRTTSYCLNRAMTTSNRPGRSREALFLSFRISKETAFIFTTEHLASQFVLRSKMGKEWITTKQGRLAIFSYFKKSYGLQNLFLEKMSNSKCTDNYISGIFKHVEWHSCQSSTFASKLLHRSCLIFFIITQIKHAQEKKEWNYSSSTARFSEFFHHKDNKNKWSFFGSSLWFLEQTLLFIYLLPI